MENKTMNPIELKWKLKYEKQVPEIQKQLDEFDKINSLSSELIPIKRSRKELVEGDVFVLQPKVGVYFYGRVLESGIKGGQFTGAYVIVVYKLATKVFELPSGDFDYSDLLLDPSIVVKQCWSTGYLFTIGNIPLSDTESALKYGFYDIQYNVYRDSSGEKKEAEPLLFGTYGIGGAGSIAYKVTKELIMHPQLLELNRM